MRTVLMGWVLCVTILAAVLPAMAQDDETETTEGPVVEEAPSPGTGRVSGRVTDPAGAPFPGIHVYACRPFPPGPCGYAVTSDDGAYSIVVPNGTYFVQFGRTFDGRTPDGHYRTDAFVVSQGQATLLSVSDNHITGIDVRYPPTEPIAATPGPPAGAIPTPTRGPGSVLCLIISTIRRGQPFP